MDTKGRIFRMEEFALRARKERLGSGQAHALAQMLEVYQAKREALGDEEQIREELLGFFLPLAEFGLSADQMRRLAELVPEEWSWDHRQIYYDFRLARWMKHIEPPTIAQSFEEYYRNAESPAQAMAFLRSEWERFLERKAARR